MAIARGVQKVELGPDCGILARGSQSAVEGWLGRYGVRCNLTVAGDPLTLPWPRTLLWEPEAKLRVDLLPAGFGFLEKWEVAIPLFDHQTLAAEVGTPEDRARTEAVCRDLRVPLYNPAVIFARDCEGVRALLGAWQLDRAGRTDARLALLRAIYRVRPLILALPKTWIE